MKTITKLTGKTLLEKVNTLKEGNSNITKTELAKECGYYNEETEKCEYTEFYTQLLLSKGIQPCEYEDNNEADMNVVIDMMKEKNISLLECYICEDTYVTIETLTQNGKNNKPKEVLDDNEYSTTTDIIYNWAAEEAYYGGSNKCFISIFIDEKAQVDVEYTTTETAKHTFALTCEDEE